MANYFDQFDEHEQINQKNYFNRYDADAREKRNFLGRLSENYDDRVNQMGKIAQQAAEGQISKAEAYPRMAIKFAQQLPDAAGSAIASTFSALPDFIENPIREGAAGAISYLSDTRAGRLANTAIQEYEDFAQQHPVAAGRIGSVVDVGNLLLPFKQVGGKSVADAAAEVAGDTLNRAGSAVATGAKKLNTRTIVPGADELYNAASQGYSRAESLGGGLKPLFTDSFIDTARKKLFAGDNLVDAMKANRPLVDAYNELVAFSGAPMTLSRADALDKTLGKMISASVDPRGNLTANGQKLIDVQHTLRDMIDKAPDNLISGNRGGFEALKEGRKLWSAAKRMEDIEDIISRANMTDNPATALKTGFRNLYHSKRIAGYSPAEVKAIRKAAESGVIGNQFRTFGTRLIPAFVAGSGGGFGATAAATAATMASRGMATRGQLRRANNVARAIAERSGMVRQEPRIDVSAIADRARQRIRGAGLEVDEAAPILALPAPGAARPMSDAQILEAQRAMRSGPIQARSGPVSYDYGDVPYNIMNMPGQRVFALPAPGREVATDMVGNSRMMSAAEQEAANALRQRAEELGLTPDILRILQQRQAAELMPSMGQSELGRAVAQNPNLTMKQIMKLPPKQAKKLLDDLKKNPR